MKALIYEIENFTVLTQIFSFQVSYDLTSRQVDILLVGGLLN